MEKLTPAPAFKRWVCSRAVDESDSPIATVAGPPTAREQYKVLRRCGWTCYSGDQSVGAPAVLHAGQGSISLEYQTYTSAHPFDTLVTGMVKGAAKQKHCQRHNGPEGCVHFTSSNTNLDQISSSES